MIIFFSGTGNSHHVATQLGAKFNDSNIIELKGEILIDPMQCKIKCKDDRIIWVFPTYSWGVPPVVARFIKESNIELTGDIKHYMVTTCGDDAGLTGSQWKKLIKKRGWQPATAYSVIMPNTYVLMKGFDVDSKELAAKKIKASIGRINEIANDIKSVSPSDSITKGSWPWFKSRIINPYFKAFCMSPKPFKANGRCIGCGKCSKACPMENIIMKDGAPQWHDRCALCLRCYHICPCDAVVYGSATKGKGQYFLE